MPSPDPSLSPRDVVRLQLLALQHNDDPEPDEGIRTAFQFAAPSNRAMTGPIERFTRLVKTPTYAPLINFVWAELEAENIEETEASLRVTLLAQRGEWVRYVFSLEQQRDTPYDGCWMTVGVVQEMTLHMN